MKDAFLTAEWRHLALLNYVPTSKQPQLLPDRIGQAAHA
jgi:hypothetical protein